MMDRQEVLAMAQQDPRFQQAADAMEQQLASVQATPEQLDELAHTLEFVMEHPEQYAKIRAAAIERGFAREQDIPQEFDPKFVIAMLLALYELEDRMSGQQEQAPEEVAPMPPEQPQMARGGLAQLGRGGDTMLAHINPREAEVLRRMGGSGGVNPNTGLHEFKGGGLSDIVSIVAPVALSYFTGGLGMGAIGGGALAGGLSAGLMGGDVGKGALGGALSGGLGNSIGGAAGDYLGTAMGTTFGDTAKNALGNALVGGVAGATQGRGFGEGAVTGALGSLAGNAIGGMAGADGSALSQGMKQAGSTFGNALTAGYSPQQALVGGALSGLATGMRASSRPSDIATRRDYASGLTNSTKVGASVASGDGYGGAPAGGDSGFGLNLKTLSMAPPLLSLLGMAETPQQIQQAAASSMSPEQKEYFNRVSPQWDWSKIQADATAQNMNLGKYVATNWNKFGVGSQYDKPVAPRMAAGGPLMRLAQGGGSGRDDTIDARLSDGEFVVDAETVALLGDGSTKAGAQRLDQMRQEVRKQKGAALARGKISPNAKSPLSYLKGMA
jgi:hypothetical protein